MSSNSFPGTIERTRLTKMRSTLPPFELGFSASCRLAPPVTALAPVDHTTTTAFDASVTAVPQSVLGLTPPPLSHTYKRGVAATAIIETERKPFVRVNGLITPATAWLDTA